ncbi:MAG: hypothetical protein QY314_01225 [Candidatus Dojkabacteria bacterium]|nr:MAG: hypothetical protein QY314_01225 [Candidatus Dojkabacteria bacterium]
MGEKIETPEVVNLRDRLNAYLLRRNGDFGPRHWNDPTVMMYCRKIVEERMKADPTYSPLEIRVSKRPVQSEQVQHLYQTLEAARIAYDKVRNTNDVAAKADVGTMFNEQGIRTAFLFAAQPPCLVRGDVSDDGRVEGHTEIFQRCNSGALGASAFTIEGEIGMADAFGQPYAGICIIDATTFLDARQLQESSVQELAVQDESGRSYLLLERERDQAYTYMTVIKPTEMDSTLRETPYDSSSHREPIMY